MVKGHLTKMIKPRNLNVDLTKDKWNKLLRVIEESSSDLSSEGYIHHYWLSRYEYLPAKKLYKAFKKIIKSNDDAQSFLNLLSTDAITYREINETAFRKWDKQEYSIRESLDALNMFRVKQPLPMLLSIMREYKAGSLKIRQVQEILQAIENFHFIFTAITSQRSSGGIAQMYALHARDLNKAQTNEDKMKIINSLKKKLIERKPGYPEFEAQFNDLKYSETFSKQKKLIQYILGKITNLETNGYPINYNLMTIEHIAAQNARIKVSPESCAKIGNLLLIDHDLNDKLGNKDFSDKKILLLSSKVKVDEIIKNASIWNEDEIVRRTKYLANIAYNTVWQIKE